MKRDLHFATFCLVLLLCALPALGQVTINSGDLPQTVGQHFDMIGSVADVAVNSGSAGADQTWDLRGTSATIEADWGIVSHADTPDTSWFPNANLILEVTTGEGSVYHYNHISSSALTAVGIAWDLPDTVYHTPWENDPPIFSFPIQYGDSWITRCYWEMEVGGFVATITDSAWVEVDGWGTVIIDDVGSVSCLRLKSHHRFTMVIMGIPTDNWFWNYSWMAPGYWLVADMQSMPGDDNEHFTSGMFNRAASGADAQPTIEILPVTFQLNSPYPNPFNPETTIPYSVGELTDVRLAIYNTLGQEIRTLVNGRMLPGNYTASWNGMDNFGNQVGTGVYYCRLQSPQGSGSSQKLLLIR